MSRVINLSNKFKHEPVFLHLDNGVDVKVKNDVSTGLKVTELANELEHLANSDDGDGKDSVSILKDMYDTLFDKKAKDDIASAGFTFAEWADFVSIAAKAMLDENYTGEDDRDVSDNGFPVEE